MLLLGGISGAGMMAFMEDFRPIFMVVTFGLLGAAFYLTYRPRRTAAGGAVGRQSKVMLFNKVMLWAVTAAAVVLLFYPQLFMSFSAADDEFTADMERTVVHIEGMT